MIDTKELRIGNYVQISSGIYNQVEDICAEGINRYMVGGLHVDYEIPTAIPITEDWLLRLGFKAVDFGIFEFFVKNYAISHILTGAVRLKTERIDSDCFLIWTIGDIVNHIYSVHQLQNLYFALTGEELKLND